MYMCIFLFDTVRWGKDIKGYIYLVDDVGYLREEEMREEEEIKESFERVVPMKNNIYDTWIM